MLYEHSRRDTLVPLNAVHMYVFFSKVIPPNSWMGPHYLRLFFVCLFILVLTIHAVSEISEYCHVIADPRKIEEI